LVILNLERSVIPLNLKEEECN